MVTVVNSKSEIAQLTTGELPVRPEIEADNARQRAAAEKENGKQPEKETKPEAKSEEKAPASTPEADDTEGDDGLTTSERKEYTGKVLRTIARKTRQVKEAEEFGAEQYNLRKLSDERAARLQAELEETRAKSAPAKAPEPAKKPERASFNSDEAYQDALVEFRVKEQLAKDKREQAEAAERTRQEEITRLANERLARAAELVPDFQETIDKGDLKVPQHIAEYMRESELFAELGYHFAKHPKELESLANMPRRSYADLQRLGVALGKIESKLQPFAPSAAAGAGEKANGQKPNASETESASATTAASGKSADPSPKTESGASAAGPSQSRAPVITPLHAGGSPQVSNPQPSYKEARSQWEKEHRVNLNVRRRH